MKAGEERDFDLMEFFDEMVAQESDEFTFIVKRTPEKRRTLSAEAMEQLSDVFSAFVGSRLSASLNRRGPDGPGHGLVQVDLRVTIDGETHTVSVDLHPWYSLVDGGHRAGPH